MPSKRKGLHDVQTRVMCHLPVNSRQEEQAFFKVLAHLKELKTQGIGVTGLTTSNARPAGFQGWWWSEENQEWMADDIVLCFVDFQLHLDDPDLSKQVEDLKRTIRKWYRHHGSPQEEVWVVAYLVIRQD
jgi:hypothetical protein